MIETPATFTTLARELIKALDDEQFISSETCDLISQFERELESEFPTKSLECADGCRYSIEVGMPEYRCASICQYALKPA